MHPIAAEKIYKRAGLTAAKNMRALPDLQAGYFGDDPLINHPRTPSPPKYQHVQTAVPLWPPHLSQFCPVSRVTLSFIYLSSTGVGGERCASAGPPLGTSNNAGGGGIGGAEGHGDLAGQAERAVFADPRVPRPDGGAHLARWHVGAREGAVSELWRCRKGGMFGLCVKPPFGLFFGRKAGQTVLLCLVSIYSGIIVLLEDSSG